MFKWMQDFYREDPPIFIFMIGWIVSVLLLMTWISSGKALVFFGIVAAIVYGIVWLVQQGEREDL